MRYRPEPHGGRGVLIGAALAMVIGGWLYFIFASSYFKIARIETKGEINMAGAIEQAIRQIASERKLGLIPQNNLFLFPAQNAEKRLKEQLLLQSLSVRKQYPNAVLVSFETKVPSLIYNDSKHSYTLDMVGLVIKKEDAANASSTEIANLAAAAGLPVLNGEDAEWGIASKAVPENLVQFIREVYAGIYGATGIEAQRFSLSGESPSTLVVHTEKNFDVMFNIRTSSREQLDKLALILKERTPAEIAALQYIDLRFGDRIFIK